MLIWSWKGGKNFGVIFFFECLFLPGGGQVVPKAFLPTVEYTVCPMGLLRDSEYTLKQKIMKLRKKSFAGLNCLTLRFRNC